MDHPENWGISYMRGTRSARYSTYLCMSCIKMGTYAAFWRGKPHQTRDTLPRTYLAQHLLETHLDIDCGILNCSNCNRKSYDGR